MFSISYIFVLIIPFTLLIYLFKQLFFFISIFVIHFYFLYLIFLFYFQSPFDQIPKMSKPIVCLKMLTWSSTIFLWQYLNASKTSIVKTNSERTQHMEFITEKKRQKITELKDNLGNFVFSIHGYLTKHY